MAKPLSPNVDWTERHCSNCLNITPLKDFAFTSSKNHRYPRSECKKCHSERVQRDELERKIAQRPNDFHHAVTRIVIGFGLSETVLLVLNVI